MDFWLMNGLTMGAYLGASLGMLTHRGVDTYRGADGYTTSSTFVVHSPALHGWLFAGVRVQFPSFVREP